MKELTNKTLIINNQWHINEKSQLISWLFYAPDCKQILQIVRIFDNNACKCQHLLAPLYYRLNERRDYRT